MTGSKTNNEYRYEKGALHNKYFDESVEAWLNNFSAIDLVMKFIVMLFEEKKNL